MTEDTFSWRGLRVLVTGCTGFLGGAVARELFARGAEVVGIIDDHPATDTFGPDQSGRIHFVHGRTDNVFRLHYALAVHEIAAVFHLAAHDPFAEDRGTAAVLQAAKLYARRIPVVTARPSSATRNRSSDADERHEDRTQRRAVRGSVRPGRPKAVPRRPRDRARPVHRRHDSAGRWPGPRLRFRPRRRPRLHPHGRSDRRGWSTRIRVPNWVADDRLPDVPPRRSAAHAGHPVLLPDSAAPPANPLGWEPQQPLAEALGETLAWYREFLQARRLRGPGAHRGVTTCS